MVGEGIVAYAGDVGGRVASDYAELFRLYCHIYCVKSQGFFLCCSRKMAKTEL